MSAIAAHPENARRYVRLLGGEPEAEGEFAPELTDDEMQEYVPLQEREDFAETMRDLSKFGFAVVDDD